MFAMMVSVSTSCGSRNDVLSKSATHEDGNSPSHDDDQADESDPDTGNRTNIKSGTSKTTTIAAKPKAPVSGPKKGVAVKPPAPGRITDTVGIYTFEIECSGTYPVIRYLKNHAVMSHREFIDDLATQTAFDFRSIVNRSVAQLPPPAGNNGYMLQAPKITATNYHQPFFFVAIPSHLYQPAPATTTFNDYLTHCQTAPAGANRLGAYMLRFLGLAAFKPSHKISVRALNSGKPAVEHGAVFFRGGYAVADPKEIMVVPCPAHNVLTHAQNVPYGHIYTFARAVNDETQPISHLRLQSFWFVVGTTAQKMFNGGVIQDIDGNVQTGLYLSTHGHGVYFLHFRVENTQRYYTQIPALHNEVLSAAYYANLFP